MPPSAYLTVDGINAAVDHLGTTYPSICHSVTLPENSVEGRQVRAFRLAAGSATNRRGVLYIGGTHARELVNPDLLVSLALKFCQSYEEDSDLAFGPKVYKAGTVKLILETVDLFFIPLLNPDGRAWVQDPAGYAMWRKNRRVNAGSACRGVDLNRNYDFLHSSGIGTSTNACSDLFRGPTAFSEPETRNVRWLLDNHPRILGVLDVHSFKQKIYHPWGDDASQTTDPNQNFQNPVYNGVRGDPTDVAYKEYIPADDQDELMDAGNAMASAINTVRGRVYGVEPAVQLYPTSGTSKDYSYARHFVATGKATVYAYTVETGLEFQPPYSEALEIIKEVSAGLVQFAIHLMCLAEATAADTAADLGTELAAARLFRDNVLAKSRTGREYVALFNKHSTELIEAIGADPGLRESVARATTEVRGVVERSGANAVLGKDAVARLDELAAAVGKRPSASPGLGAAVKRARTDLPEFASRSVVEALKRLDERTRPRSRDGAEAAGE